MRITKPVIKGIYEITLSDSPWAPPGVSLLAPQKMWPVTRGQGTVVAVLDTGIDYTHTDLQKNIIGGASFVPGEDGYQDENGHGTHVAGIIAANGSLLGVAPEAKLLAVKVMNKYGMGTLSSIVQGIAWARNWTGDNGEKVNIINMSLGSPLPNTAIHKEIIAAVKQGITVLCAAGNSGDKDSDTSEISYPAYYSETVAVGAVDLLTGIADFSNSNNRIDIVAPGVDTYSTYPGNKYVELSGTSMAAPHISGAVALIYSRYQGRFHEWPTPEYTSNLLHYQSIDLGELGFDNLYGYGLFSFNYDGGKVIRLIVGQHKYMINNSEHLLGVAPFIYKDNTAALIGEICQILNTPVSFIAADGTPEKLEIWY